jgi:pimeloyl-ACP methyl ester carboxylesterase
MDDPTPRQADPWGPYLVAVTLHGDKPAAWRTAQEALGRRALIREYGPFGESTPLDAAERLQDALDEEQRGPDYFCGHDFGAAILLALCTLSAWRMQGLILVGATPEVYTPEEMSGGMPDIDGAGQAQRRSPGFMDRLEFITTPTLIVVGEADAPFFQRGAELLHGWMPFSRLVRIPDAAHHPHVENPAVFAAEVAAFLHEMEAAREKSV